MPDPSLLALFVGAALVLLVVPGPAVLYIVSQSIDQGRLAGVVSTFGIHVGTLVHITAASLGISSLLVSSALAFNVVKYVGAAYLIFLGLRKLFGREKIEPMDVRAPKKLSRVFYQGILVNVLNPKTALFFFAFLPQFVDVTRGAVALQIAVLGLMFAVIGLVSDGLWALAAGTASGWLKANPRFLRTQRSLSGSVFLGLGVATALSGPSKNR